MCVPGSVMVISPHPDDEVIGAGGLVNRIVKAGGEAAVGIAHIGTQQRWDEAQASCGLLGAQVFCLRDPADDSWLDAVPLAGLVGRIEGWLDVLRPECLLLPDPGGFHQEHRVVAEAAMAAMRPSGGTGHWRPPVVACFEEPSDSWRIAEPMRPNWYVSLAEVDMEAKRKAMLTHVSQVRNWPSERSLTAMDALARLRGAQAGVDYAEAYTVLRWLT